MDFWANPAVSKLFGGRRPGPGFGGVLEYYLYPFQLRFLGDRSRFRAWESSRQIGKSFTLAVDAVLAGLSEPKRHQAFYAASERQALELLDKAKSHVSVFEQLFQMKLARKMKGTEIELLNGSRIRAFPANGRTARGVSGDIYLDEFAHVQGDRSFWTAVLPIITRAGYRVTMASTPLGDDGVFYECCYPKADDKDGVVFSKHRTTVHDAMAEGLEIPDLRMIQRVMDVDSFAQEYECVYLSYLSAMFPWALLKSRKRDEEDGLLSELIGSGRVKAVLGVDVGRKKDLTSLVLGYEYPEGKVHLMPSETMRDATFEIQKNRVRHLIYEANVTRCRIDATGIGMQMAEELEKEFPGIVQGIAFNDAGIKNALVTNFKIGLERDLISLPDDGLLLADCHKIRKHVTPHGNVVYDAPRDDGGHADRFWGAALATAAVTGDAGWEFTPIELKSTGAGWDTDNETEAVNTAPFRAPTPDEMGFDTEVDLEDLREEMYGDARPPPEAEREPMTGMILMPETCLMPPEMTAPLLAIEEDPCKGCDADRRLCKGRHRDPKWRRPQTPPAAAQIARDQLREMMIEEGAVPATCRLDGIRLWTVVSVEADPCASCDVLRVVCGGRPRVNGGSPGPAR